jgi:hypothetical protein
VNRHGFRNRWWWRSSRRHCDSGLSRRSKSWRTSSKPYDWYCARVAKCASLHNSDILSPGQICSTSACRQNRTRHSPHQHFRLVLQSGIKDNVKFKVTPVVPVAPCLPVFQWSPHQQHLQIDETAAGEEWSEMWPQKDVFASHFRSQKHRVQLLDWAEEVQRKTSAMLLLWQFARN